MACVWTAAWLGGCGTSDFDLPVIDPAAPADVRVTLPPAPPGVAECLGKPFPAIPDRALTRADVAWIISRAKVLDRSKTACGRIANAWIEDVRRDFARP